MKIHVRNLPSQLKRRRLEKLAGDCALPHWHNHAEVDILFTDDSAIKELNRKHLARDHPTDVIAFPLESSTPGAGDATVGDVVVSVETAHRQASARGIPVADELALYVVHGLLHLAGYQDSTRHDRKKMYAKEREVLERNGYSYAR